MKSREIIGKDLDSIIQDFVEKYPEIPDEKKDSYVIGVSNLILEAVKMLYYDKKPKERKRHFEIYLDKFKKGVLSKTT